MFQHTVKVKRIFNSRYRIIPLSVSPFILIELIISTSFAVIAVAMLIAALRQTEEMSRRTECASSLRQIHIAMDMYAFEYNDWYPMSKERKYDLEDRLIDYAVRIIKLSEALPPTKAARHVS